MKLYAIQMSSWHEDNGTKMLTPKNMSTDRSEATVIFLK